MARNQIVVDAPPEVVYDTLLDARQYPKWVGGAQKIRDVDRSWPRVGSRFHHRIGIGPATIDDSTKLVSKRPGRGVKFEVRVRPFGIGYVDIDLKPKARGRKTKITMTEDFTRGPLSWVVHPLRSAGISIRNVISLRRLRRLVTSRAGAH